MTSNFNEAYYDTAGQGRDRPALWFYERLAHRFFHQGSVLDFGCGTGFLVKRLANHFQADGYDISDFARKSTQMIAPSARTFSSLEDIPHNTYTGIIALHVLEHLSDRELDCVLTTWHRILNASGRVVCVIPDISGKGHRIKGEDWAGFRDASHVNLKARDEWKQLFTAHGFTILSTGTDGLWDFPYSKWMPKVLDGLLHSVGTVIQFVAGRLLLAEGEGESAIFLLKRTEVE